MPIIPDLESFPGLVLHSHDYRHPEIFQGKRVVILGAGPSGQDLCLDVSKCADKVYLSHKRTLLRCKLPDNLEQHGPISCVSVDGTVQFDDGQERRVDAILLCTGYKTSFPFLHDDCNIQVRNNRVTHLYKNIFNTKFPTLSFIGLCYRFCIFPRFHLQAQYIAATFSGRKRLPPEDMMNAEEEKDFQEILSAGLREKYAHFTLDDKWDYDNTIALLAGADMLSPHYKDLHKHIFRRREHSLMEYRNDEFILTPDGMWKTVQKSHETCKVKV